MFNKIKPNLNLNFQYHGLEKYLKESDLYDPQRHKDPKQKWWNNQKASEMSQDFLPAILNATDEVNYLHIQMLMISADQFLCRWQFILEVTWMVQ